MSLPPWLEHLLEMRGVSSSARAAGGAVLALSGGGWLAHASSAQKADAVVAVTALGIVAVIAACMAKIAACITKILELVLGYRLKAFQVKADTKTQLMRATAHLEMAQGLATGDPERLLRYLRMESFNADRPTDRRMGDKAITDGPAVASEDAHPEPSDPEPGASDTPGSGDSDDGPAEA
jgi:hypothetical protein